jgi:hypothetical protein
MEDDDLDRWVQNLSQPGIVVPKEKSTPPLLPMVAPTRQQPSMGSAPTVPKASRFQQKLKQLMLNRVDKTEQLEIGTNFKSLKGDVEPRYPRIQGKVMRSVPASKDDDLDSPALKELKSEFNLEPKKDDESDET